MKVMMDVTLLNISILLMLLVSRVHSNWSSWGPWSECSRTCGGGASYSLRSCLQDKCHGEKMKFRSCSTQTCPPDSQDFRAHLCSGFNDDYKHNDQLYEWIPHIHSDNERLCALICQAKGHDDIVVELAPNVLDGTPCVPGKKDMCINGSCVPVGCDYELYSTAVEDECGVCNGDGSTCKAIKGNHRLSPDISRGIEEVVVVPSGSHSVRVTFKGEAHIGVRDKTTRRGLNQNAGYAVPEGSYEVSDNAVQFSHTRSGREILEIAGPTTANLSVTVLYIEASNTHGKVHYQFIEPLQHIWKTLGWTHCSAPCGGGFKRPHVKCIDIRTGAEVDESHCDPKHKPATESQLCNEQQCPPRWITDPWSDCSKTCGGGRQTRNVYCAERSESSMVLKNDMLCSGTKPDTNRVCNMDHCPMWYPGPWSQCTATCGTGTMFRRVLCKGHNTDEANGCDPNTKPAEEKHCVSSVLCIKEQDTDHHGMVIKVSEPHFVKLKEELIQEQLSFEPSFVVGDWSPCSAFCGVGTQLRSVVCQVLRESTNEVVDLPVDQCDESMRPLDIQICNAGACMNEGGEYPAAVNSEVGTIVPISPSNSLEDWDPAYVWRYNGYTECSVSCLGGVQTAIIECYSMTEDRVVSDMFCDFAEALPEVQHSCNNFPCPPMWEVAETYGECTVSCGGGVQYPQVYCIQELAFGSGNTIRVPDEMCTEPRPDVSRMCNHVDCPPAWKVTEWLQCTQSCGGGIQTRAVSCVQLLALGHPIELPEVFCMEMKPEQQQICNQQDCGGGSALWVPQPWSDCPVTCGEDLQIRAVLCMKQSSFGEQEIADLNDCDPLEQPLLIQPCAGPPCPVIEETPSRKKEPVILSDNSNFIQEHFNSKLIFTVGGSASVFPHTTVIIKCPVKWFKRSHIKWHRNSEAIERHDDRAKVLKDGRLKIHKVADDDVGTYSCVAGTVSEHFTLSVQDKALSAIVANSDSVRWSAGRWSDCSESCGDGGVQIRSIHCEAFMIDTNSTKEVEPEFCQSLDTPPVMQPCFLQPCPSWVTGDWSDCNTRCIKQYTAIQRRTVDCVVPDGTVLPNKNCGKDEKPSGRQQCHSDACEAVWRPSKWTQCSESCGDTGTQTRTLGCVYKGKRQPADVMYCRKKIKPELVRACNRNQCPAKSCVDESTYCSMVKRLKMCSLKVYEEQCCHTCNNDER